MLTAIMATRRGNLRPLMHDLDERLRLPLPGLEAWLGRIGPTPVVLAVGRDPDCLLARLRRYRLPGGPIGDVWLLRRVAERKASPPEPVAEGTIQVVSGPSPEALCRSVSVRLGAHPGNHPAIVRFFGALSHIVFGSRPWPRTGGRLPLFPMTVSGRDHVPAGPLILAANHQSWMDVMVLFAACPFGIRFLAKDTLLHFPPVAWLLRTHGEIPVDRGHGESLAAAREALRSGDVLVIFPEGTIPDEENVPSSAVEAETGLLPGKTGAVRLAIETGAAIVPVGVTGTREALPIEAIPRLKTWPWPRRVPILVRFGSPIRLEGMAGADRRAVREETNRLMRAIATLIDRPVREASFR